MARLPYPSRESLPAELAELLESLPRNNITEMFAHATSLTAPFLRLAQAQFTALELSVRQRELVILAVAGLVACEYEYAQHIPVSAAAGIPPALRERIRNGDFTAPDDPSDQALLAFVSAVVAAPRIADDLFNEPASCCPRGKSSRLCNWSGSTGRWAGCARFSNSNWTIRPGWIQYRPWPACTAEKRCMQSANWQSVGSSRPDH
jgi:alkylhydroperoxidase family enzyme